MIAIEGLLKGMDSNLRTCKQPFFWAGAFRKDQIDLIRRNQDVIAAVELNVPLQQALSPVIKDDGEGTQASLNFIATAPGRENSLPAHMSTFLRRGRKRRLRFR